MILKLTNILEKNNVYKPLLNHSPLPSLLLPPPPPPPPLSCHLSCQIALPPTLAALPLPPAPTHPLPPVPCYLPSHLPFHCWCLVVAGCEAATVRLQWQHAPHTGGPSSSSSGHCSGHSQAHPVGGAAPVPAQRPGGSAPPHVLQNPGQAHRWNTHTHTLASWPPTSLSHPPPHFSPALAHWFLPLNID